MAEKRIILGIDPGTNIMGYGIISIAGNTICLVTMGVLKLNKYEDHMLRLKVIFERIVSLVEQYHPDELSIEAPFFGKNIQSMLKLGRAQGVAIAAALSKSVPIFEYSPRKIKQSITGKGAASKEQVAAMLGRLLSIRELPETLDATDAVAVAVCHFFQNGIMTSEKKYSGWKNFVTNNPERIT
jgi:crossover junction endodeoxyribonuclease RuvC